MGRPKLNREVLQARVDPATIGKLKQMALELGFQWEDDGNTGALLDAIALVPVEVSILDLPNRRSLQSKTPNRTNIHRCFNPRTP